jgi:hypothetical protein
MYNFDEDNGRHANQFAGILNMLIQGFWQDHNQNTLKLQKIYFDKYYNWDLRASQWQDFLSSMTNKS